MFLTNPRIDVTSIVHRRIDQSDSDKVPNFAPIFAFQQLSLGDCLRCTCQPRKRQVWPPQVTVWSAWNWELKSEFLSNFVTRLNWEPVHLKLMPKIRIDVIVDMIRIRISLLYIEIIILFLASYGKIRVWQKTALILRKRNYFCAKIREIEKTIDDFFTIFIGFLFFFWCDKKQ